MEDDRKTARRGHLDLFAVRQQARPSPRLLRLLGASRTPIGKISAAITQLVALFVQRHANLVPLVVEVQVMGRIGKRVKAAVGVEDSVGDLCQSIAVVIGLPSSSSRR